MRDSPLTPTKIVVQPKPAKEEPLPPVAFMNSTANSEATPSPNISENVKTPVGSPMKAPAISPLKAELNPLFIHHRLTNDIFELPSSLTVLLIYLVKYRMIYI